METKDIVESCKLGNQVAQGILFNTHYRQMYNLAMRMLSNHHDTEDVLIIAFTKVFENIHRFEYRGEFSLSKWIKTIVINETIRFVNSKSKIDFSDSLPEYKINMDESDLSDIDADEIYTVIESMPKGYRLVFNLFAIEGYSHKEIADALKITENTSKSQLRKARIHIIEKLSKSKEYGRK